MIWLHRYAMLVALCTFLLVIAGALVTSNDAAFAIPDWPLSYGSLWPEMTGGILYQHTHRMLAGAVGLLTVVLAIWIQRVDERRWMRRLGWSALALVSSQALLGGATVVFLLPKIASVLHAFLAQAFFCITCVLAYATSHPQEDAQPEGLFALGVATTAILFLQMILGAAVRHRLLGVLPHMAGAMVAMAMVLWYIVRILIRQGNRLQLRSLAIALPLLMFAQVLVGLLAYVGRVANADAPQPMPLMVASTVAHVALGALTLAVSVLNTVQDYRFVRGTKSADVTRGVTVVS